MPRIVRNKVLSTNLSEHPAVKFWRKIGSNTSIPEAVIVLKEYKKRKREKSAVYRLKAIGPSGTDIIAKRCWRATWMKERTIYTNILPHLPMPTLQCYGFVEEPNGKMCWLFLEDAGENIYLPNIQEHRMAAAQWLGLMHTTAPLIIGESRWLDCGPPYYLEHLKHTQDNILQSLNKLALNIGDIRTLQSILSLSDIVKSHWNELEQFCERIPQTLVHGDFSTKNLRLRNGASGLTLLPIDWETAGWGVPAVDIIKLDISTYWMVVRDFWSDVNLQDIKQLANIGELFRYLVSISWDSTRLKYQGRERAMWRMRYYEPGLLAFIKLAGWSK